MKEFMAITKALSDPGRVRILLALEPGELCVCQITELFGLAPSTMSKHLTMLRQAGLVESRKEDRWVYYGLPERKTPALVREMLNLMKTFVDGKRRGLGGSGEAEENNENGHQSHLPAAKLLKGMNFYEQPNDGGKK